VWGGKKNGGEKLGGREKFAKKTTGAKFEERDYGHPIWEEATKIFAWVVEKGSATARGNPPEGGENL